ncbi:MAG TPA: hypothetical protein GXX75_23330 [Clostridiales bacterium]|nr:hypothetical protein [Clostridiales bacterium]
MIPDKLPMLPKKIFNQDWTITVDQELSEDGYTPPADPVAEKCWFSGKAYQVMDAEKHIIRLEGVLVALGDLFPDIPEIAKGTAQKGAGKAYKIYRCQRPLNPDGSVYATVLELM